MITALHCIVIVLSALHMIIKAIDYAELARKSQDFVDEHVRREHWIYVVLFSVSAGVLVSTAMILALEM